MTPHLRSLLEPLAAYDGPELRPFDPATLTEPAVGEGCGPEVEIAYVDEDGWPILTFACVLRGVSEAGPHFDIEADSRPWSDVMACIYPAEALPVLAARWVLRRET